MTTVSDMSNRVRIHLKKFCIASAAAFLSLSVAVPAATAQNYNNPFPTEPSPTDQRQINDCAHNPRTCTVPDGIATGASREQQDAWNKCLVAAAAARTVWQAVVRGGGLTGAAAYASCDWDAIRG